MVARRSSKGRASNIEKVVWLAGFPGLGEATPSSQHSSRNVIASGIGEGASMIV
jgi:hypothetical protein